MNHRKVFLPFLLVAILVSQTACPKAKPGTVKAAAEAAKDIGGGTRDAIKAVGEAYRKGLITLAQKDKLADLLLLIAKGGQKGVDAIERLQNDGFTELPADRAALLNKLFSDEVVAPFLKLLTEIGALTDSQSIAIRAAVATLRTTILLLSQKIGREDAIKKIEAAPWREVVAGMQMRRIYG